MSYVRLGLRLEPAAIDQLTFQDNRERERSLAVSACGGEQVKKKVSARSSVCAAYSVSSGKQPYRQSCAGRSNSLLAVETKPRAAQGGANMAIPAGSSLGK